MLVCLEILIEDELNRKWEYLESNYDGPLLVMERSYDDEFAGLIVKHEGYPEFAISYSSRIDVSHQYDTILVYVDDDYTMDFIDDEAYYNAMCKFVKQYREDIEEVGKILDMATDRIRVL